MLNRLAEGRPACARHGRVVLPDYQVEEARIVSMPRERIIDANDYAPLGRPVCEKAARTWQSQRRDSNESLRRWAGNVFKVSIDLPGAR